MGDLPDVFARTTQTPEGCWAWQGSIGSNGYGTVWHRDGRTLGAHRVAWELRFGPIPAGLIVCHACDNPICLNPDHLLLGTPRANSQDMPARGSARPNAPRRPAVRRTHEREDPRDLAPATLPALGVPVVRTCAPRHADERAPRAEVPAATRGGAVTAPIRSRDRWAHGECSTGKRAFPARADAKAAAKSHRSIGDHVRPYLCPECDRWHLGHMPAAVLRGDTGAKDYYRPQRHRRQEDL